MQNCIYMVWKTAWTSCYKWEFPIWCFPTWGWHGWFGTETATHQPRYKQKYKKQYTTTNRISNKSSFNHSKANILSWGISVVLQSPLTCHQTTESAVTGIDDIIDTACCIVHTLWEIIPNLPQCYSPDYLFYGKLHIVKLLCRWNGCKKPFLFAFNTTT